MKFRVVFLFSLLLSLALPAGASAAFHFMNVREVFPGDTARPTAQYVELQMYAGGQTQVQNHSVTVYNDLGTENSTATFTAAVANGDNQRSILVASPDFEGEFGITPDLVISAPMMDAAGGAVCFDGIDCMSWGSFGGFAGPTPSPVGSNAPAIPDGSSLVRSIAPGCETLLEGGDDTDDSAPDFDPATPSPRNNATAPTEKACVQPTPEDKTVSGASLKAKGKQSPSAKRPKIVTKVGLGEDGKVRVTGKGKVGKTRYFLTRTTSLTAGKKVKVNLKPVGKLKKRMGKALKRGKKLKVKLTAKFTDEAGNTTKKKKTVKLK